MLNEAEWCLAGDQDVLEVVSVVEAIRNKRPPNLPLELVLAASKAETSEEASVAEVASEEVSEAMAAFEETEVGLVVEVVSAIKTAGASVIDEVVMVALLALHLAPAAEVGMAVQTVTMIEGTGMVEIEVVTEEEAAATEETSEASQEVIESRLAVEIEDTTIETVIDMMVEDGTMTTDRENGTRSMMGTTIPDSGEGIDGGVSILSSFDAPCIIVNSMVGWWVF